MHVETSRQRPRNSSQRRRYDHDASSCRRKAIDSLEFQRNVEDRRHPATEAKTVAQVACKERSLEDDVARSKGFGRDLDFHKEECSEQRNRDSQADDSQRRSPRDVTPTIETDQQHRDRSKKRRSTQEVDPSQLLLPVPVLLLRDMNRKEHRHKRGQTQRHLHQERPPPPNRIHQHAPQGWPRGGAERVDDVDVALELAALPQRHRVREEDADDRVHAAAADAGEGAGEDEVRHRGREAAPEAAEAEDDVGEEEAGFAGEDVGELAVEGLEGGEGEEVSSEGWISRGERHEV